MCIPRADRAVNRGVTDFVRVGMESLHVSYDFLGLCDPWAAHIIVGSAFKFVLVGVSKSTQSRRSGENRVSFAGGLLGRSSSVAMLEEPVNGFKS